MDYRYFGQTGEKVSVIGYGSAAISGEGKGYGFGAISEKDAISLLREAVDNGINLIDTAPIYGFGTAEKRIGKAFNKEEKDKILLVSKSGVTWHQSGRVNMTNDPEVALNMLHQSLKDLKVDVIDLYMVHWPDERVDIRSVMEVFVKAKEQGKIKYIGLCNTHETDFNKAQEVATIEIIQSEFNGFNTTAAKDLFPIIQKNKLGFMGWGTLDKGVLTGRLSKKRMFEDHFDCRKSAPWWNHKEVLQKISKVDRLKGFIDQSNHSLLEFALAHNLIYPEVSQVLCGARNSQQLKSIIQALTNLPNKELVHKYSERFNA